MQMAPLVRRSSVPAVAYGCNSKPAALLVFALGVCGPLNTLYLEFVILISTAVACRCFLLYGVEHWLALFLRLVKIFLLVR